MPKALLLVLSNPAAGRDDEFNEWYTNRHMPEVVQNCASYVRARRYKLSPAQLMPNPNAPQYLAAYEIEADDLQAAVQELGEAMGSGTVSMSDSLDLGTAMVLYFEPISDEVSKT